MAAAKLLPPGHAQTSTVYDAFNHRFRFNVDLIEPLIERDFRKKIGVTTFAMRFEIVEVQSSVLADLLLLGEFKQGVILLASEFNFYVFEKQQGGKLAVFLCFNRIFVFFLCNLSV